MDVNCFSNKFLWLISNFFIDIIKESWKNGLGRTFCSDTFISFSFYLSGWCKNKRSCPMTDRYLHHWVMYVIFFHVRLLHLWVMYVMFFHVRCLHLWSCMWCSFMCVVCITGSCMSYSFICVISSEWISVVTLLMVLEKAHQILTGLQIKHHDEVVSRGGQSVYVVCVCGMWYQYRLVNVYLGSL